MVLESAVHSPPPGRVMLSEASGDLARQTIFSFEKLSFVIWSAGSTSCWPGRRRRLAIRHVTLWADSHSGHVGPLPRPTGFPARYGKQLYPRKGISYRVSSSKLILTGADYKSARRFMH